MSSLQPFRKPDGGRIDRARSLAFTFDKRRYRGYPGDTLASALLANGVKVMGRSMKFHRPRGVLTAGVEEPNALLSVDWGSGSIPTVRATAMPLLDGLEARTQNRFPSVNFDLGRVLDFTRVLWPAGFYYKMFKWPHWRAFEWAVRRAGGLGRLPGGTDGTRYRHLNGHCDVLVVGSGPSGLAAALDAARRGEDVLLVEQDMEFGGSLLHDPTAIEGACSEEWLATILAELDGMDNVRLMANA
ncbi:MAG: FAD-dependent oxidoreductase, partial [Gammaproteobacteria bacterium]|nr:FAD-dependent oxidoreductase [Gammaproteobacteria bacterium]